MKRFATIVAVILLANCRCDGTTSNNELPQIDVTVADGDRRDTSAPDIGAQPESCDGSNAVANTVGEFSVHVDYVTGAWNVRHGDDAFLSGGASCDGDSAVAVSDSVPSARGDFGNFEIDLGEEWSSHEDVPPRVLAGQNEVGLVYEIGDRTATLKFSEGASGGLRIELFHDAESAEFRVACGPGDGFFGLGTQVTTMNLRGRTYPLWTEEQGNGKPEGSGTYPLTNRPEAAYAPMGVLHSTAGWSGVVTHDGYTEVDLCNTDADYVAVRSHRANPGFVFVPGTPRERMTAVTEYVGRVRRDVPPWAFGLWVDSVTGPARLAAVTDALRNNGIPASAIWSEDWIGGSSSSFGFRLSYDWVWDEAQYPDLPTLVDGLHSRGFAFLAYFNTFIPEPTSIWPIAQAEGYLVEDADGTPITFLDPAFRNAGLVDLFDPAAVDWLKTYQLTAVNDIGIDGWMADFSEWYPLEAPDVWERHNLYALEWQRVNEAHMREARPDGNYVYFPRSGWASVNGGTGGVAPVMWGGDQNTEWEYDDGFPTIIPIGAHVGLSGVAIFGSDIAGYNSIGNVPNTTKELWFRWAATAAFHPLMRTHHGGDECANWNFDRDAETLAHLRRWSSIHSLLLPEFQALYGEASAQGWPISRHPWLVEPEYSLLWGGDQYAWFLGDDILVSPVLTEGATTREVVFPGDGWWPLLGSEVVVDQTVDAPVTEVPAFVRPGRALVLLAEAPDSFYGADDGVTTGLDDVVGRYRVAMYPGVDGMVDAGGAAPFQFGARELASWAPASATFNGTALPICAEPVTESCVDGDLVWLVDVTAGSLVAGATVDLDAPTPVTVGIGIAGAAWGELASPTSYSPNPSAPSWCPEP